MTKTCWTRQFLVKTIRFKGRIWQCWWLLQRVNYWCKKNLFYTRKSCHRAWSSETDSGSGLGRPLLRGDNVQARIITTQRNLQVKNSLRFWPRWLGEECVVLPGLRWSFCDVMVWKIYRCVARYNFTDVLFNLIVKKCSSDAFIWWQLVSVSNIWNYYESCIWEMSLKCSLFTQTITGKSTVPIILTLK